MFVVEAGVDYEANGAQHVSLQVAEVAVWILEESHFFAEALGVECPAFRVGRVVFLLAKFRQLGKFLRERDLQVMSGNPLVIRRGFEIKRRALREIASVDHDMSFS